MAKKFTLIKFGASWCGPCKQMAKAKTLERFEEKFPEVKVVDHELPDEPDENDPDAPKLTAKERSILDLADEYGIKTLPTLVLLDSNDDIVKKHQGGIGLPELIKFFKKNTAIEAEK